MQRMSRAGILSPAKQQFFALGAYNTITTADPDSQTAVGEAAQRVLEVENHMSARKPGSDVSRINKYAGKSCVPVHSDTYFAVKKSLNYSSVSGGCVDITLKPVIDLWRAAFANGIEPIESELSRSLLLADRDGVVLKPDSFEIGLKQKCQSIDLGFVAKGFAADAAAKVLEEHGVENLVVNVGDSTVVRGGAPDGSPWRMWVHDPLNHNGSPLGCLMLNNAAVSYCNASKSNNILHGVRYNHVIDPKSGYPCTGGLLSVTTVSSIAIDADGLSTALYILGLEKGMELVSSLNGLEAVFATDSNELYISKGLKDIFPLIQSGFRVTYFS